MHILTGILTSLILTFAAVAQGLPQDVADAYRAYEAAVDAENWAEATAEAETAWRAAEAGGVDPETTAILAANFGEVALVQQDNAMAARAYERAVALIEENSLTSDDYGRYLSDLARAYLGNDDNRDASRAADRAIAYFGSLPQSPAIEYAIYFNQVIGAFASYNLGRERDTGRFARPAIDFVVRNNNAQSREIAQLAFVLAQSARNRNQHEDAVYYAAISAVIARNLDPDDELVNSATDLLNYAAMESRERVPSDSLYNRVMSSGFRPIRCEPEEQGCPGTPGESGRSPDDMDSVPMWRIPPQYPPQAGALGLSGYVDVQFSVSPEGRVEDVQIVDSSNRLFERAAIRSVEQWRYWPQIVNGVAETRTNVRTRLDFQIEY